MKYMGSKARIAKHILPFLKPRGERFYYEPFAGGMNMMAAYDYPDSVRVASDSNSYLIEMFQTLQAGWIPDDYYDRDYYNHVRKTYDAPGYLIGWLGFNCSYSGKWFGGFAGRTQTRDGIRDYQAEAKRNVLKQMQSLSDVRFLWKNYLDLIPVNGSVIYCDPPYQKTTGYVDNFDHDQFWEWVRGQSRNCHVFVSEYQAPDDFECVWQMPVKSSLSANGKSGGSKKSMEKLFTKIP